MIIPDPLRLAIEGRTALLVCGLGVSISAHRNAPTWRGLIKSGIEEAVRRELGGKATPPKHWSVGALALIEADDVKSWLAAADLFTTKLGGTSDGRYRAWIKSTVGSLRAENTELLEAIAALQCRIATTNYDDLIRYAPNLAFDARDPILWSEPYKVAEFLQNQRKGVLY